MRYVILVGVLALTACTTAQQEQAKQVATDSLNALCDNLSSVDLTVKNVLTLAKANATAFRVEADGIAATKAICDQRPVSDPGKALAAATAAFSSVVALEAQYGGGK